MLRSICIFTIIFLTLHEDAFPASMSLADARKLLYERSDMLKASTANVESKEYTSNSLKWLHGPLIAIEAQELWGETRIDIHKRVSTPLGEMPVDMEENYNFSGPRASITGTIPILTGGKIGATQKIAKYQVDEARAKHRNTSIDQDIMLIGRYFGLQLATSIENLRADTLKMKNEELARAVKFEREGLISPVERMSVKVARDKAEREHLKARNAVRTAKLELQRLIRIESIGVLSTPLFVLNSAPNTMEYWVEMALKNNPRIAMVESQVHQANQGVEMSKSSWFPQIFGFGEYSFIRHYQTAIEPSWLLGLGASLTLWDSTDRVAAYKSARASLREAKAMHADIRNQIQTAAETAWLNAQNAREQYFLTASEVELARENLDLKRQGFGEGLYTSLDVTQAWDQLLEAEVGRRMAAYQFVVNYATLFAIAGQMDDFMKFNENKNLIVEK